MECVYCALLYCLMSVLWCVHGNSLCMIIFHCEVLNCIVHQKLACCVEIDEIDKSVMQVCFVLYEWHSFVTYCSFYCFLLRACFIVLYCIVPLFYCVALFGLYCEFVVSMLCWIGLYSIVMLSSSFGWEYFCFTW